MTLGDPPWGTWHHPSGCRCTGCVPTFHATPLLPFYERPFGGLTRREAVRAVVAAQWAVACVMATQAARGPGRGQWRTPDGTQAGRIAKLPTAEEIVTEIVGEAKD